MIGRREAIKSLSLAPFFTAIPSACFAGAATTMQPAYLVSAPSHFVYDANLPAACALAAKADEIGHALVPIKSDKSGFWRSNDRLELQGAATIFGATTRRTYFVLQQLTRLHWNHRLKDARIIDDGGDFSFWTLQLQTNI